MIDNRKRYSDFEPNTAVRRARAAAERHQPLRLLRELADEFGVSVPSLQALMQHDAEAPQPRIRTRIAGTGTAGYYNLYPLHDMRRWWAKRRGGAS